MLEYILSGIISGLSAFLGAYFMFKIAKNDIKNEIFDFLESQEGMNYIASCGKLFGAGIMSVLNLKPTRKTVNLFGAKVPMELVMAVISRVAPQFLQGEQGKSLLENLKL